MFEYNEYIELKKIVYLLRNTKIQSTFDPDTQDQELSMWDILDPNIKRVYENDIMYFRRRLGFKNSIAEMSMTQTDQSNYTCQNKKPNRKKYYAHPVSLEYAAEDFGLMPASEFLVEEHIIQRELQNALYDAINTLDEKCKQVVILYYFQGLSERAIASKLSICQKAVNNRKKKALGILKERLKNFE